MSEAWIIDAVRTPRGVGKIGKGALAEIHPQQVGSTVLRALAERNKIDTAQVDDVIWGTSSQVGLQGRDLGRMSALDAGYDVRSSGVTLDRFCGSGHLDGELRRLDHHVRHVRPGRGRRVRADERQGPPAADAGRLACVRQRQHAAARQPPADPAGHLRRHHRDDGRHHPRRRRQAGRREPAPRRHRHRRGPLRQEPHARLPRGRNARPRPRGVPAPADDARRPRRAETRVRGDGRHRRRRNRRHLPQPDPAEVPRRRHQVRPPRRQLVRAWSTGRRRCSWRRRNTPRAMG